MYKGTDVDNIWLTHDLMETMFQGEYRNEVDVFFTRHSEYLTFRMFHFVPYEFLSACHSHTRL